jgi:sugar lactone lactonase YvrE
MNDGRQFEREAQDWLELGPSQAPEHAIQAALLVIETTPQRRGPLAPWRYRHMTTFIRVAAAMAVALAIGFGTWAWWASGPATGPAAVDSPRPAPLPPTSCPGGSPPASGTIATIAGNGSAGSTGDGAAALDALIDPGSGIAVDNSGNVYFGDANGSVRRIRTDGTIEAFASGFQSPNGLVFDAAGDLYVADGFLWIKKVDPAGVITTFAGTGVSGNSGNEGLAIDAQIQPAGLAIGPDGDLYFDDLNNYRRIDPQGIIHAFAGSTTPGFDGDGGPAVDALFGESVVGMAPMADGSVYLGDPNNFRIRRVGPDGIIRTAVGTGVAGNTGDRGPAIAATVRSSPFGMTSDPDGNMYFTDWQNASVRRVTPAGIIDTVVGKVGTGPASGDCGPATSTALIAPVAVAYHEGALFIVESGRIRMVVP